MAESSIQVLLREYPGDAAWAGFVAAQRSLLKAADLAVIDTAHIPDEEMAIVLVASGGIEKARDWWQQSIPALDGHVPKELYGRSENGIRVLRTCLMRLPR